MAIIRKSIKVFKLHKLEKVLAAAALAETPEVLATREKAKGELFELIGSQRDLRKVLEAHDMGADDLDPIYEALCEHVGVVVKKSLYVPVEALAFKHSLTYVLDNAEGLLGSEERQEVMAMVLTSYFKNNDVMGITESRYLKENAYEQKKRAERAADKAEHDERVAKQKAELDRRRAKRRGRRKAKKPKEAQVTVQQREETAA